MTKDNEDALRVAESHQKIARMNGGIRSVFISQKSLLESSAHLRRLVAENERLNGIINTPQADDFLRAVSTEAEHQRQRWGSAHDSGKTPADWFWLVGFLAGKALNAQAAGDRAKAEHHVITTAAALANWHRAMSGKTNMRPGIDGESEMKGGAA